MVTYVTDILTATPAYVSAAPTSTRAWQWLRGSTIVAGATTNSYTVTAADLGQPITVNQTETNFLGTASATSIADGSVLPFAPAALFALNEPGVWYDLSDTTTLYTDNVGSISVTAPGQTVGLMLDKSKGGEQSLPTTGWTVNSGNGVVTIVDNVITITGATTTTRVDINSPGWVIGDYAKITVNASIGSAVGAAVYVGGGAVSSVSAGSRTYGAVISSSTLARLQVTSGSATFTVTARSRTPGNHATQSILGQRPIYGVVPKNGRRNLLTYSEDFGNAVWNTSGLIYTAATGFDGVTKNSLVTIGNVGNRLRTNGNAVTPGTTYTFSFYAKLGTATGNRYAVYDVSNATLIGSSIIYDNQLNATTYTKVSVSFTAPAGCTQVYPYLMNGNTTTGTIFLDAAQLELGSSATSYQKVTNTFDVTETGVPSVGYLAFDTDKWMVTNTITPGTDKAQVFVGVNKFGTASYPVLVELGTGGSGGFVWHGNGLNSSTAYFANYSPPNAVAFFSDGGINQPYVGALLLDRAGTTGALSEIAFRKNGVAISGTQDGSNPDSTGNYLAYPLYIGRRGGTTLPFNGHLYSLIVRFGSNLSAARISAAEVWVSDKTSESNFPKIISSNIYTRSGDTILDRFNSTIERRAV